jgi:hypothetical protein
MAEVVGTNKQQRSFVCQPMIIVLIVKDTAIFVVSLVPVKVARLAVWLNVSIVKMAKCLVGRVGLQVL